MDWSPFSCLPRAETTASGLLRLDTSDQEVELLRRTQVEVRHDGIEPMAPCPDKLRGMDWVSRSTNLTLTVTTHRIVLSEDGGNNNSNSNQNSERPSQTKRPDLRFLHLSNVHLVAAKGGPSLQSPFATYKVAVSTYTYGDVLLVFRNSAGMTSQKQDRDVTLSHLEKALARRQWEAQQRLQERVASEEAVAKRRVGVDHVMTKHRVRHQQAARLAEDALSGDAEQLLQEAGALLKVIQKYTVLLERYSNKKKNKTHNAAGNDDDNDIDDDDEESARRLASLLSDMGMTSALSKSQVVGGGRSGGGGVAGMALSSSQRDYYELTARQLADFLLPRLAAPPQDQQLKKGRDGTGSGSGSGSGMMTLTDVYCLFNRARGTNLISPEDLREACALLGGLNVGLSQRTFPSGVIVIQLDSLALSDGSTNNNNNKQRLLRLCPTTALEASHELRLSPLLALEQLEEAERLGWVCRDTTLETVRFYPNKFNDWVPQ